MDDSSSTSSGACSNDSLPQSDDGFDAKAEVRRALVFAKKVEGAATAAAAAAGVLTDDFHSSARSGDSPPPPEKKLSSRYKKTASTGMMTMAHNVIISKPAANGMGGENKPGKRGSKGGGNLGGGTSGSSQRYQYYVPDNNKNNNNAESCSSGSGKAADASTRGSKKDGQVPPDPPEMELPIVARSSSLPRTAEESAMKARSRLIQLQHHRDRDILDTPASPVKSVPGGKSQHRRNVGSDRDDAAGIIGRRDRTDSSFDSSGNEDLPSSSYPRKNGFSNTSYDLSSGEDTGGDDDDDDDDDDDYPRCNMDPIESDNDESGNNSDSDDISNDIERHNDFRSSLPNIHRPPPTRAISPVQTQNDYNYMNSYPSSAPQRPSQRQPPQHLIQHIYQQQKQQEGVTATKKLHHPNASPYQSHHPHQNISQSQRQTRQPVGVGGSGGDYNTNHSFSGIDLRPPATNAQSRLYASSTSLLETGPKEAHSRDEVQALLNESKNFLKNLQSGAGKGDSKDQLTTPGFHAQAALLASNKSGNGGGASGGTMQFTRKMCPPPPPFARINPPPPKGGAVGRTTGGGEQTTMSANFAQGRKHRPPPPPRKSPFFPSTPTNSNRPVITASEAMEFVISASARQPGFDGDTSNDEAKRAKQNSADMNAMHSYLTSSIQEDAALTDSSGYSSPSVKDSFDFDGDDDDDFEENTSLSMHAEAKFGSGQSAFPFSKHAEDKHGKVDQGGTNSVDLPDSDIDMTEMIRQKHHAEDAMSQMDRLTLDDHSLSDSRIFRQGRPRPTHLDPPDADDDLVLKARSSDLITPFAMQKKTSNGDNEFVAETAIPTPFQEEINGVDNEVLQYIDSKSAFNQYNALGPRSKRFGGITGIVLDAETNEKVRYRPSLADKGRLRVDSPSPPTDNDATVTQRGDPQDSSSDAINETPQSDADKDSRSEEFASDMDTQSTILMTNLCAHLLPIGLDALNNQKGGLLSSIPSLLAQHNTPTWDDDDPDDPGYLVHQLTSEQLNGVESAFEKMVNYFEQSSEKSVRKGNNKNFERDLEEAELILDQEEKRYEAEAKSASLSHLGRAAVGDSNSDTDSNSSDGKAHYGSSQERGSLGGHASDIDSQHSFEKNELRESVPDFPGIYPPGKGKPGEMECFYLPIITKSQKTGFEPTKDLVLKPGSVFANNYLVQGELGSAAFSTAYRCIDLSSEEDEDGYQDEVCLKVIKNTKDYFDQSIDEIKILRLLKDTGKVLDNNIVEMRSFFYHREHLVIVTELLRQNLYEFGKSILESRGPAYFTRRRLSHISKQCLVALKFVHELGLVHCDIKPENILLSSYSRALIKVIDFGSSSFVTDRQSSYIQSRSYRAPEVILGLPYDGKIDMWSIGCVVAEMYTGEVTFQNDSELSMLSRIEAICGPFPRHMIAKGRNSHRIFTDSGLIYEKITRDDAECGGESSDEESASSTLYSIYQPKMTTLAARLGFAADLMEQPRLSLDDEKRASFVDFVSKLLSIDPDLRPTAAEALRHPWILSSLELTEEDIRYPPEE